ncbi:manganese-transporting ATPase 13A1-like [Corvus moneduloides]|nr:manganese-transporting ATPase 13A1-like [Corvus moneduloides]
MESLAQNRALLWALLLSASAVLGLLSGSCPELNLSFGLVEIPPEFRLLILAVLAADFLLAFSVDRLLQFLLGSSRLRVPS